MTEVTPIPKAPRGVPEMSTRTLSETRPVARKPHLCCACLGTIPAGHHYFRQSNVDGSEAWTWKAHELCFDIVLALADYWGDDEAGPDPYDVREMVANAFAIIGGAS